MTTPSATMPALIWMRRRWQLRQNPFPETGIAVLGGSDKRENGMLFQPEVQSEKVAEAIEKFVIGGAFSGLKFGYLWSLGTGLGSDQRGFGKSVTLQHLIARINVDFGRELYLEYGLSEADAAEEPMCAVLASFDMANARSLAAVFFEATRYACRERLGDQATLAERLRECLIERVGTDDTQELVRAVYDTWNHMHGRNIGPPNAQLVQLLCAGDGAALGLFIESVTSASRARVGAANYFATFLLFARAAGMRHVLLGCDQLEDFAATTTTRAKRSQEVERFRDYAVELQPMADMLTIVVTLHPRAQQAIYDMWRLADLPDFAPDRVENQSRIVILDPIRDVTHTKALLRPYLHEARLNRPVNGQEFFPFTEDAIATLLSRSDGKPRDLLKKAYALIDAGSARNWDVIDGERATSILDTLTSAFYEPVLTNIVPDGVVDLEDIWTR